jgi:hypothetical protein
VSPRVVYGATIRVLRGKQRRPILRGVDLWGISGIKRRLGYRLPTNRDCPLRGGWACAAVTRPPPRLSVAGRWVPDRSKPSLDLIHVVPRRQVRGHSAILPDRSEAAAVRRQRLVEISELAETESKIASRAIDRLVRVVGIDLQSLRRSREELHYSAGSVGRNPSGVVVAFVEHHRVQHFRRNAPLTARLHHQVAVRVRIETEPPTLRLIV